MDDIHQEEIVRTLVDAVQHLLQHNLEAVVPGLGTFSVAYEPSRLESGSDDCVVMVPPRRTLAFAAAQEDSVAND